jgi:hypothetical protein
MTKDEALKLALEALENNKQMHYYCEDTWYSCPQHEDGCANDSVGDECNCGADKANAEIDKVITAIKEALAQTQEPVRIMGFNCKCGRRMEVSAEQGVVPAPQRTWVGLTNDELTDLFYNTNLGQQSAVAQAIALLKERNT